MMTILAIIGGIYLVDLIFGSRSSNYTPTREELERKEYLEMRKNDIIGE